MAASDLQAELVKSAFKVDVDMQKKLTKAVLQQLEDASGDISSLAVKWWDFAISTPARCCTYAGALTAIAC